jgi:diguanylate cyclase (GGDEF)-like protein
LRHRLPLLFVAFAVLLAGVVGSDFAGMWWDRHQRDAAVSSISETAAAVSTAVGNALRADRNFDAAVQAMVLTSPGMTNRQLAAWSSATDVRARYPGTAGFAFVEPVARSALPAFVASVEADPPAGAPATPYAVFPPGRRPEYCLERFGEEYVSSGLPIGLDMCALPGSDFHQVLGSGVSEFDTFQSVLESGSIPADYAKAVGRRYGNLFVIVSPAYRAGSSLTTVAARRSAFEGWMVGTFSVHALLRSAIGGTTDVRVVLRYRHSSGSWQAIGRAGTASAARLAAARPVETGGGLNAEIEAVVTTATSTSPLLAGLLMGAGGSIISILVFGFLVYLASSRRRAFRLVERRTQELRHRALHDALTDLPNRLLLFDRAEHMLRRARWGSAAVGALYIDIDDFKEINDTFGHQVGDEVLQAVAARLRRALRESDTVGRLGGDEFVVLVDGPSLGAGPELELELVADRLLAALAEPFFLEVPDHVEVSVHASIGAALDRGGSADELVRNADIALYAAKTAGKNRAVVYRPEMQTAAQDRMELEAELRRALDEGELYVLYQPIVDLGTMSTKALEALVRWRHPTRGTLVPDAFIPLAEESGLVVPLGRFVLGEACRQLARWRADGHDVGIAVNVSPRQLETDRIVDDVRQAVARHHLPPGCLTLEITETTLMEDTASTIRTLAGLKKLGVRIAVDDFGTGYSSLSYLRKFPIDALKIDRSFIMRLGDNVVSGPLVHTVVELGRALGVETLAEGIEEQSQLAWLRREHCDSGQGFLFGEPLSPEEAGARYLQPRDRAGARGEAAATLAGAAPAGAPAS